MKNSIFVALAFGLLLCSCADRKDYSGNTGIATWKDGKTGAISITLDDASINQFRQALPIMDTLGIKATFFINTAHIRDNQIPPKYFGRPVADIIKETASAPTDRANIFERASALRFVDMPGAVDAHNNAGSLYENEKYDEAFKVIDDAYAKARQQKIKTMKAAWGTGNDMITWKEIKEFAANGHEFGSHTISHPRLSVLDEPNLMYELEKCKEEIRQQLGSHHTFSAECPFGTENERVMQYAYKVYPALRNRMPEPFLAEINRGSDKTPGMYEKPYIQWQRGPLAKTTVPMMKAWVDTLLVRDNVWLVLTFHGVDGIGWEAKPHQELKEYFSYMKEKEDKLWIATFGDVTKYMRERMAAKVAAERKGDDIVVSLEHSLDKSLYDFPLTLKTYVPDGWDKVRVKQGSAESEVVVASDEHGSYAQYQAVPNAGDVALSEL